MSARSPTERYKRHECIGNNPPRMTYKATNQDDGTEVVWDEILIDAAPKAGYDTLTSMAQTLRTIDHPNIIHLHCAWIVNSPPRRIVLVTELGTETLRSYVNNVVEHPLPEMICNWCTQIHSALLELHQHGIQHRGLTLDNIFIDRDDGVVKLGLPLLESVLYGKDLPIAAPEVETRHDLRSDIWLFGLAVLDMCTNEEAYNEYPVDERRTKICEGMMPIGLNNVCDPVIADFIITCLLPIDGRPSVGRLGDHQIFADKEEPEPEPKNAVVNEPMTMEKAKAHPDFVELLRRQEKEREELLKRHKEAKQNLLKEIKDRQSRRSLRDLVNGMNVDCQ